MSSPGKKAWLQGVAVTVLFAAITVPMYYPISLHMGSMITDRYDGLLQTWIITWDVHKFITGLGGFWNANIFWPHPDVLAYSDHRIGQAMIAAPFYIMTGNPIFAHNAMVLLSFAIGGLGMFFLVRRLTGNGYAALVAAVVYAYCPWRMQHAVTLNMVANQWLPFALFFLHRSLDNGRLRDGALAGVFFGLHSLSSFYHAAMGAVAIMTVVIAWLVMSRFRLSRGVWTSLVAGALVSGAMVAPTIWPYYRVSKSQGMVRDLNEIENLSADPLDYLRAPKWDRLWGDVTAPFENRYTPSKGENRLFPGVTVIFLSVLGLLCVKRSSWEAGQKIYLWVAAVAFVLSLGPYLHLGWKRTPIPLPYLAVYYLVPGFKGIRVASRFGVIVEMGLAVLASYEFLFILKKIGGKAGRVVWITSVFVLLFAEFYSSPLPHYKIPTGRDIPEVYRWLAAKPGGFAIAELPQAPEITMVPEGLRNKGDPVGFRYVYYSVYHWKNTINGRSSFIPPTSEHVYLELAKTPSEKAVKILKYLGVKYLIFHGEDYYWETPSSVADRVEKWDKLFPRAAAFGGDIVYEIPDPAGDETRKEWTGLDIAGLSAPANARPGSRFNVEVRMKAGESLPVYSFELVKFEISAKVKGPDGLKELKKEHRNFLMVDPGEDQWEVFTVDAPAVPGDYEWEVNFEIKGKCERIRIFTFTQRVGDYPDSDAPGVLEAEISDVEIPQKVQAGGEFEIRAVVKNAGDTSWRAYRFEGQEDYRGVVSLGIRKWFDEGGKELEGEEIPYHFRGRPARLVPPGGTAEVVIKSRAPARPGRYRMLIEMVDENIAWFGDSGGNGVEAEIEVIP